MLKHATGEDIGVLGEYMWELYEEAPEYRDRIVDPDVTAAALQQFVDRDDIVVLIDTDRRGVFIGCVVQEWHTGELHGCEVLLYVRPEHRGGILAARMISEFEAECRRRGCTRVSLSTSTGIRTDRTIELYARLGYEPQPPTMTKRL